MMMKIAGVTFLLICAVTNLLASDQGISALDGLTPQALQPGSPSGSHPLSGLDTINLYNGSANIVIPLLQIGGRGEAGYSVVAHYDMRWDGIGFFKPIECSPNPCWAFNPSGWASWDYRYRPAGISLRDLGQGTSNVTGSDGTISCTVYGQTLTRIVVGLPDGTEIPLVDTATGGSPQAASPISCANQGVDRGTTFVATDGSAMTFIADNHIYDSTQGTVLGFLTGTLYFRDGRRFHFGKHTISGYDAVMVDRIQDRNGNQTTFDYNVTAPGFSYAFYVTDPLGRLTRVSVGKTYTIGDDANAGCTPNNLCIGLYDEITYSGFGAQPRTITIYWRSHWLDRMPSLQSAFQPSDQALFGGYSSSSAKTSVWALSKIVLPDGHAYQFRYNAYAEVARLDLPTGARYEFDWGNGPGTDTYSLCTANSENRCPIVRAPSFLQPNGYDALFAVYRRVKERREYNAGSSWVRRTTYDVAETGMNELVKDDPLAQCGLSLGFVSGACTKVTVNEFDPQGQLSTAEHYFYGAASKYQSLFPQAGWYSWWLDGKEFRDDILTPEGPLLRKELHTWLVRAVPAWWSSRMGPLPAIDPRIGTQDIILDNGKMARQSFAYSASENTNNVIDLWEYDYGSTSGSLGSFLRHRHTDFVPGYNNVLNGIYLRDLIASEKIYDEAGVLLAETDYAYDETVPADAPSIVQSVSAGPQRGNRTKLRRWRNTDAAWLVTTYTYDVAGNILSIRNPRGPTKYFAYLDCSGTYAFVSTLINEASQGTTVEHDCNSGAVTSIIDANLHQTAAFYGGFQDGGASDSLDRISKVIRPNGQQTTYKYSKDMTSVTTAADKDQAGTDQYTTGDQLLRSMKINDALGRHIEKRVYTSSSTYISSKIDLDALGRASKMYNPVDMAEGQAYTNPLGTSYIYDALSRLVATIYADGSRETNVWAGDTVLNTDPAGTQRRQQVDSLGRIIAVVEDPAGAGLLTTYRYDALDNLLTVVQDSQTRSFTYNSLKQLRSITSPEVGQLVTCDNQLVSECYTYDSQPPNDTLKSKTAAGAVTTFTYDNLDRLLKKTYSDGTPTVEYAYDFVQVGCLYSVGNSVVWTRFTGYAPGCSVLGSVQTIDNQNYSFPTATTWIPL